MNKRIDLKTLLGASGRTQSERVAIFALLGLGIVESLANGLISAVDALQVFFHADNCLFVHKELRVKVVDEIMSRGVQLPDLFEALPTEQAQREFNRELASIRDLCLKALGQEKLVA